MGQADFETPASKPQSYCVVCRKPTPVRDMRDFRAGKPVYCGRVHAALARFGTRYRGTNSGPMQRPTTEQLIEKTKWQQA